MLFYFRRYMSRLRRSRRRRDKFYGCRPHTHSSPLRVQHMSVMELHLHFASSAFFPSLDISLHITSSAARNLKMNYLKKHI